jgi:hypothetical protein
MTKRISVPGQYILAPVLTGLSALWLLQFGYVVPGQVNGAVTLALMVMGARRVKVIWR